MRINRWFSRIIFGVLYVSLLVAHLSAATSANGVPVSIFVTGYSSESGGYLDLSGYFESEVPSEGRILQTAIRVEGSGELKIAFGQSPLLMPKSRYELLVGQSGVDEYAVQVVAPPGYRVRIDGKLRNRVTNTDCPGSIPIVIEPLRKRHPELAGLAHDTAVIGMDWSLSLGQRMAGGSAGEIVLVDSGLETENDWSRFWKPSCLECEPPTDEVAIYRAEGIMRRIIANQVAIAIDAVSASSFTIKCYSTLQLDGADSEGLPKFVGLPYVTYTFGPGDTSTSLLIQRAFRDITSASDTTASISYQDSMAYKRINPYPFFEWIKRDWSTSDVAGVPELYAVSTVFGSERTEAVEVRPKGGSVQFQLLRFYQINQFGEWLVREQLNGDGNLQSTFDYHFDTAAQGSFGHIKSIQQPGGAWSYLKYNTVPFATDSGQISKRYKPFLNTSYNPGTSDTIGEVTSYTYTEDHCGAKTLPQEIVTTTQGQKTAWSKFAYTFGNGITSVTRTDYANATSSVVTTRKVYTDDSPDPFTRSTPIEIVTPDGVKKSYIYNRGWWAGASFTVASGGSASQVIEQIVSVRMPSDTSRSTQEVTVRDASGLVVLKELKNALGTAVLSSTKFQYNIRGQLIRKEANNGAISTYTYTGPNKTTETDEYGVTTSYTYDSAGRVATVTRSGAGSEQETVGPLVTSYEYDSAGHILYERVGSGAEQLVSAKTYDQAGFLLTETSPNSGTAVHCNDPANREYRVTASDGSTKIEKKYADGRRESITGTGVVPTYYLYNLLSDGRIEAVVQTGSSAVVRPRWEKTVSDWLGRKMASERPGAPNNQNTVEGFTYDASTGLLVATAKTGYNATRFVHDGFGYVIRSGIDMNGDGSLLLASTDRISDSTEGIYEYIDNAYWLTTTKKTYPTSNSATSVTTSISRKRLTGHSNGCLEETIDIDVAGNLTWTKLQVDRTNATATRTTTKTGIASSQVEKLVAGKTVSVVNPDGLTFRTQYDALLRPYKTINTRGNSLTQAFWPGTTLLRYLYDDVCTAASGKFVQSMVYDTMGRVIVQIDAVGNSVRTAYNLLGKVARQWGTGTYPVEYLYNSYGERIELRTWRTNVPSWASGTDPVFNPAPTAESSCDSRTIWNYDTATGLMLSKTDALNRTAYQTYNVRGQTATRVLARTLNSQPVTTTYGYDTATGELLQQNYSDGTPAVSYAYNRAGQISSVSDVSGVRTISYNSYMQPLAETLPAYFGSRVLTRLYENTGMVGRVHGFQLLSGTTIEQSNEYGYTSSGRFSTLMESHLAGGNAKTFRYGYLNNAALINSLTIDENSAYSLTRAYEPYRDLVTSVATTWGASAPISQHEFTYDDRSFRTTSKQQGSAFADYKNDAGVTTPLSQSFVYNGRGELVQATSYLSSTTGATADYIPGRDYVFDYDGIGNRTSSGRNGAAGIKETYTTNAANAYTSRTNHLVQIAGTVDPSAKVEVKDATATTGRKGSLWSEDVMVANGSAPWRGLVSVYAGKSGTPDLFSVKGCVVQVAMDPEEITHDPDGNLSTDGIWQYSWDAENRLYWMETRAAAVAAGIPNRALEFRYDYMGRRVMKRILNKSGTSWVLQSERRYVYDGWNLIAEYTVTSSTSSTTLTLSRSYLWGMDIVHSLSQAGGVGALVQINDHGSHCSYLTAYDGNGNITALVNASTGALSAAYEYSPYGEPLRAVAYDTAIADQPFRFSTKYTDFETGLVYYGRRYYDPRNGRFICRDPKEEFGGLNLYGFVGNNSINRWDILGMYDGFLACGWAENVYNWSTDCTPPGLVWDGATWVNPGTSFQQPSNGLFRNSIGPVSTSLFSYSSGASIALLNGIDPQLLGLYGDTINCFSYGSSVFLSPNFGLRTAIFYSERGDANIVGFPQAATKQYQSISIATLTAYGTGNVPANVSGLGSVVSAASGANVVYLWDHGFSGGQQVGPFNSIPGNSQYWSLLGQTMAEDGLRQVYLMGCEVGAGTDGLDYVRQVASSGGFTVTAYTFIIEYEHDANGTPTGALIAASGWPTDGLSITAFPDGTVIYTNSNGDIVRQLNPGESLSP